MSPGVNVLIVVHMGTKEVLVKSVTEKVNGA